MYKYTVFENVKQKTRFFTSYDTEETEGLQIVAHVKTVKDAQALCEVTEKNNIFYFLNNMRNFLNK